MALIFSSGSLYLFQVINLLFTMYVARVLTPEEIGVFAIVAAITMSSNELKLLGTGDYLIREKLTKSKVQNSLGVSLITSWSLAIGLIILSGTIADFYNAQDIKPLIIILSTGFWLSPFSSINYSLLRKEFDYLKNILIGWSSRFCQFGSSFILLVYDYSYFSLALGIAIGAIVEFLLTLVWKSEHMLFFPRFNRLRAIIKFGTITSLTNLIEQQSKLSFDLIIGKLGTTTEVAFFSRAKGLVDFVGHMTLGGLKSVALPYLSKQNKDNKEFLNAYIKSSDLALSLLVPIICCAAILNYELINLLFGEQWSTSSTIIPYIAAWYLLTNIHPFYKQLLLSIRFEKQLLIFQFFNFALIVVCIFTFHSEGLASIAKALIWVGVFHFLIVSAFVFQILNLSLLTFLINLKKVWFMSLICSAVAYFIQQTYSDGENNFMIIALSSVILPMVWLSVANLTDHPIYDEVKTLIVSKIKRRNCAN